MPRMTSTHARFHNLELAGAQVANLVSRMVQPLPCVKEDIIFTVNDGGVKKTLD